MKRIFLVFLKILIGAHLAMDTSTELSLYHILRFDYSGNKQNFLDHRTSSSLGIRSIY